MERPSVLLAMASETESHADALRRAGFEPREITSDVEPADLAVIDCDLDPVRVTELYAALRAAGSTPTLLLVGPDTDLPSGVGGAGDEVALKPVPPDALVYRLQALLIRAGRSLPTESGAWASADNLSNAQIAGEGHVVSVFAPKGGVGKTTVAFNLAVALGQLEQRTVLIDGSVQFGDLRSLLKVPVDAPSILDLPTDRIAESDLSDVLWRDPSGIDILLAPPRIEMAEMITPRDVDKILSLLRRVYSSIVIDMSSVINDINLAFLDASDTILEIVTYDSTTIHNTIAMADTFRSIGYPASKVRYLVNRADSPAGIDPGDLQRALGRVPEHQIVSDGQLVVRSNNEGVPFVLSDPSAQVSRDMARVASELVTTRVPAGAGRR